MWTPYYKWPQARVQITGTQIQICVNFQSTEIHNITSDLAHKLRVSEDIIIGSTLFVALNIKSSLLCLIVLQLYVISDVTPIN